MRSSLSMTLAMLLLAALPTFGQTPAPKAAEPKPEEPKKSADGLVVTKHKYNVGGRSFDYVATAGTLPIKDEKGDVEANVFFVAYTKEPSGDKAKRPLMFSFNGGPGSASVWLHLGALGPKIVAMPDAKMPAPPYKLIDNPSTWLDKTDLVFIDPVGTGYSRATKPEFNKKFHGLQGDIQSVGEFMRMYLTRNERWASPLFVVGESYGTTRASGLAGYLFERGIAFNGIILISSVLQFQSLSFDEGNDLPYILFLPTYTATAFYHKKLPPDLMRDLPSTLAASRKWAETEYLSALHKGARLTEAERTKVAETYAKFTGLSRAFVEQSGLKVSIQRFCKEILRDQHKAVGRFDSRYAGFDIKSAELTPLYDPSYAAIRPAYTSTINDYLRRDLGYQTDLPYYILGEGVGAWEWGLGSRGGYPDVSESLQSALAKNPAMRVYIASGYYDLATPFIAIEHTLDHMALAPETRKNITIGEYEAGHMMYLHPPSPLEAQDRDRRLCGERVEPRALIVRNEAASPVRKSEGRGGWFDRGRRFKARPI